MTFQKNVLMIAIVLFILIMSVVGVLMTKSKAEMEFPPEIGNCPDYFKLINTDGERICKNVKGLGTQGTGCQNVNFDNKHKTRKAKCQWAKGCGVEWDGITNQGLC